MNGKHIHFIGICGVAMSALALAFHKKGYQITGSDKGFYPPISTHLKNAGIEYYPGWHPEKMGTPDLVIVGNVAGSKNPEWLHVQENNIPYKSYPEAIAEFFVKENSIVCAGTYGKSTSTAILAWILKENNFDPTYMFGCLSMNDIPAAELTDSKWSLLEGDEYKSSGWDMRPKFSHYSPIHLLLTSVVWDHADVYPTEQKYIEAFSELAKSIPKNGQVVVSEKVNDQIVRLSDCSIVRYGKEEKNDYQYSDVQTTKDGVSFNILNNSNIYNIRTYQLGDYMADNMTGCFAMAHQIGIEPDKIIKALETFKGVKRRLEKKFEGGVTIFDDIAHSPSKAEAVLASLKKIYKGKIIAVFEPNSGNRQQEAIPGYADKFKNADEVIIPRLTQIKHDQKKPEPLDGQSLCEVIAKTHNNVKHIENDERLIDYLVQQTTSNHRGSEQKKEDVIVFLGSHGFRGMIENLVERLS